MGGGGGKSKKSKAPAVQTIDYGAMMAASTAAANAQIAEQYKQLIANYPKLEDLTFGTVGRLSGQLDNATTREAQEYIRRGLQMGDLDPQMADPTSIEQALYDAGERDLALGRSLSPEQERAARQSARAAFAARGLGTSLGSSAAEILNRDAAATARERERQGFASAANEGLINNVANRRLALANLYNAGAGNLIAADPYSRAVGPGFDLGLQTQGNQMQQIGNTFRSANELGGSVAAFNANANNWRNFNNYAMGRMGGGGGGMGFNAGGAAMGALSGAASGAMIGSVVPGIGTAVGAIGGGLIGGLGGGLSDRREKTDIKKIDGPTNVIGIPAYEYRYKGEKKKRRGVMAQDVAKVLPEAVTEVDYQGKKRLAIKPAVIGAALARELTEQTKAVAA